MKLDWTPRACPLCTSRREGRVVLESNIDPAKLNAFAFASRKLPEYMHPRMVECADCGMLYGNPVLSLNTISEAYQDAAFDSGAESDFAGATYRGLVSSFLQNLPARGHALDIGAGDGAFLEQLLQLGFAKVTGVEPSSAPVAAAKPAIRPFLREAFFYGSDFPKAHFDLITCFQVMEHFWDPAQIARDAFELLKPGGVFLTVVHNRKALSAKLLGEKSPIFDLEHLQLFDPETGRRLLTRAGFHNVKADPVWNRYPLHYWMKLAPIPPRVKGPLIAAAKAALVGKIPVSIPPGNLAITGVKP